MEKYFFFKPYNCFGGVRLSANRVFGNESINDMSIDERLLLVAEKVLTDKTWENYRKRLSDPMHVRYQDLPQLPDGLFYDCGLERTSRSAPLTTCFVEPDSPVKEVEA